MTKHDLTQTGAAVFYWDKTVDEGNMYVEGIVTDAKPVDEAISQWNQDWTQDWGWVLEIAPVEPVEDQSKKYRHITSCKAPENYRKWLVKRTSNYTKRLSKILEED